MSKSDERERIKIAIEKDLRLGTIQSGLRKSYKRLKEDASRQESDKDFNNKVFDVNASICELLFWVNANDESQYKNNKVEYAKYRKKGQPGANSILGLKHAYNASKHEMSYVHLFTFEKKKVLWALLNFYFQTPHLSLCGLTVQIHKS